jgi:hypothetical protein
MSQQNPQRFKGGRGSKEKGSSQKFGVKNNSRKGKFYSS